MKRETRMMIAVGGTVIIVILLGVMWWHATAQQIKNSLKNPTESDTEIMDIGSAFTELGKSWRPTTSQPTKPLAQ